jgi:hypothetical protein
MNAQKMWRRQLAEAVIIAAKPQDDWDTQHRVVFYLKDKGTEVKTLQDMAFGIYGCDSIHTTDMLRDACVDLLQKGILATKTAFPNVSYRLHPEMSALIDSIHLLTQTVH